MTTMGWMTGVGLLVLAVAAGCVRALERSSASTRHVVWTAALTMLVALPVFEMSGARVELPVPAGWLADDVGPAPGIGAPEASAVSNDAVPVPVTVPVTSPSPPPVGMVRGASSGSVPAVRASAEGRVPVESPISAAETGSARSGSVSESGSGIVPASVLAPSQAGNSFGVVDALLVVWAVGAFGLMGTLFTSHLVAWRLTRIGVERASPHVARRLAALCVELGIRRPVRLVVSTRVRVPATWGVRTPTIVLPPHAETWPAGTLERVLLHELAHIQRGDCWTTAIGACARALHWPNPWVWVAARRQRAESEHACDDLFLARGQAASAYAEDLLGMVRALASSQPAPQAAMAMARNGGVGQRVRAVLDPEQRRSGLGVRAVSAFVASAVLVAFCATALTPVASAQDPASGIEPPEAGAVEPPVGPSVEPWPTPEPEPVGSTEWSTEPFPSARPEPVRMASFRWLPPVRPLRQPIQQRQELCAFSDNGSRSVSMSSDDDEMRIRWETDDCRVDVEIEGRIVFADDDRSIVSMERNAVFDAEERIGNDRTRVRLEGSRDGIERRFWVDGDEVAWGAPADEWLATVLPELFRHTTLNAEARVRRFLAEGGPDRVFDEVAYLHSDHVVGTYLEHLMEMERLNEEGYARVIDFAAEIESDHGSGELLLAVVDAAGLQPAFQTPMLRAAEGIESDHQKTRVLQALLRSDLTSAQIDDVIASASTIESDHNLGMVLSEVAQSGRMAAASRPSFLRALETIESDHNHASVLEAFLDTGRITDAELVAVLDMTRGLDSDHARASILQRVGAEYELEGDQVTAYLQSASRLDSDHQMAATTEAIIERADFTDEHLDLVLSMASRVDSDHQRATILERVVLREELSTQQLQDVLEIARGLDSDHQLSSTLTLVLEDETLNREGIAAVLEAAARIDSGHQRSTVLLSLARLYSLDSEAADRYLELTDDLSRSERERVRSAIRR